MATKQTNRTADSAPELSEPLDTPQPTAAEVLAAEAISHAAWLTLVRETAYTYSREWGICSSGRGSFLRDVGIPFHETARYADSDKQPVITVDPFGGLDPSWVTPEGIAGLIERQRASYLAQRAKIARGIMRARSQGYGSEESVSEVFTTLGLDQLPATMTAQVRIGYDSYVTVSGLATGTTPDQVSEAFRDMIGQALGFHLPGWQHVKVTDGFSVSDLRTVYDVPANDDDKWTF